MCSLGARFTLSYSSSFAEQVYAVIPTLNEEHYIEDCLRSLMIGDEALNKVQFVVVDGGSDDRTIEIVESLKNEFSNLSVMHNPQKLQSAALNLAAKKAPSEARIMVRCDAHSIYPTDFVLKTAAKLEEVDAVSVVVPMDAVGHEGFQQANAWIVDKPFGSGGSAHRGGDNSGYVDHGHHAAFNLRVYREIGGYDENFSHNEDAEYDFRVVEAGYKIYMDADSRIQYMPRPSFLGVWKQYFKYGRGRAMNLKKHGTFPKLRQLVPVLNLGLIIGSVLFYGWLSATGLLAEMPYLAVLCMAPLGYVAALLLIGMVGVFRLGKLSGLYAGLALGAMHNSWALGFLKGFFMVPVDDEVETCVASLDSELIQS